VKTLAVRGDLADPAALAEAGPPLRQAGLIIYPTDTLYALGGLALVPLAARRVRAAKGRAPDKPLPLIAGSPEQVARLCALWPETAARLAGAFWPGPLTLVFHAAEQVPEEVTAGSARVAVRIPASALARALCGLAGPLIATSANLSGAAAPETCASAVAAVGKAASVALDAGPCRGLPSTIVDLTGQEPVLLRPGAVPWALIEAALGGPR
jgi:L-threonylcarbamoyladenylate synthase